jgi:stage V sporulation protein AC
VARQSHARQSAAALPSVEAYQRLTRRYRAPVPVVRNAWRAFLMGGGWSLVGQGLFTFFTAHGWSADRAASPTAVVLIGIAALLTGVGWYDALVKWGGMGGSLPITGFANAMVAPAMEFRREGLVLGVGAKLFTVAGPVLAYGMAAAFVMGALRLWTGVGS